MYVLKSSEVRALQISGEQLQLDLVKVYFTQSHSPAGRSSGHICVLLELIHLEMLSGIPVVALNFGALATLPLQSPVIEFKSSAGPLCSERGFREGCHSSRGFDEGTCEETVGDGVAGNARLVTIRSTPLQRRRPLWRCLTSSSSPASSRAHPLPYIHLATKTTMTKESVSTQSFEWTWLHDALGRSRHQGLFEMRGSSVSEQFFSVRWLL